MLNILGTYMLMNWQMVVTMLKHIKYWSRAGIKTANAGSLATERASLPVVVSTFESSEDIMLRTSIYNVHKGNNSTLYPSLANV